MNRIAPNNQLPATHFIEVWKGQYDYYLGNLNDIFFLNDNLIATAFANGKTIAIFRIRENKLPTKHKF